MSRFSSFFDQIVFNTYGSSGLPSPDATTRDPELRKLISELEKIQGRSLLSEQKEAVRAEIAVLKAQASFVGDLLNHELSLADLDQKDAASQRKAIVDLRESLINARAKLSKERATWNSKAVDVAFRAASDATATGGYPASAAWQSLSHGLVADADSTVLDPQLPATLTAMSQEWKRGVQFTDDFQVIEGSWGEITDEKTRSFIRRLAERAQRIHQGQNQTEGEYNSAEKSLRDLIAVAEENQWSGRTQEDRNKHIALIREQYKTTSKKLTDLERTSPYDRARSKLTTKEDEHHRFEQRAANLEWAWKEYKGEEGKASEDEMLKMGQAIFKLQQSGWAAEYGFDNLGNVFDDDGDGKIDRYLPKSGDARAVLSWKLQYDRGGGRYGLKKGTTGELVRFEVKATPEQLAYLRDDAGRYAYVVKGDDGERVYLTPEMAQKISAPPVQARGTELTLTTGKTYDGLKFPDGSYRIFDPSAVKWRDVSKHVVSTEETGWISSEQTAALLSGSPPTQAALKPSIDPEVAKSSVQYTEDLPPATFLREGEKMKLHAEDMIQHPDGSIRLRGGEVIPASQIAGPVQVFASLTDEHGLVGPEGSWAKWKGLQAMGKVKEVVAGGALGRGPVASRVVGNI